MAETAIYTRTASANNSDLKSQEHQAILFAYSKGNYDILGESDVVSKLIEAIGKGKINEIVRLQKKLPNNQLITTKILGYDTDENEMLTINENEAEIVRAMYALALKPIRYLKNTTTGQIYRTDVFPIMLLENIKSMWNELGIEEQAKYDNNYGKYYKFLTENNNGHIYLNKEFEPVDDNGNVVCDIG